MIRALKAVSMLYVSCGIILLCSCAKRPEAERQRITRAEDVPVCGEIVRACEGAGWQGTGLWRKCVEEYIATGGVVQLKGFSRQSAMSCSDLRKALYGKRYWFNGMSFP